MRSHLRELRSRRGLTQQQLAERAGVARQTVGGLEAGEYGPGLEVALRLARALGCAVEELFSTEQEAEMRTSDALRETGATRVAVALLGGRSLARPLKGLGQPAPAQAIAQRAGDGTLRVSQLPGAGMGIFLAGCDPALGLLGSHVWRSPGRMEAVWFNAGNAEAHRQLARREVHAAALHGRREGDATPPEGIARFRLGDWQLGIVAARGNPKDVQGAPDLGRPDLRVANREPGSGARQLLDRILAEEGVAPDAVPGYARELPGHRQVAEAVALGAADVGVVHAGAAEELGLHFIPLADEVCDLLLWEDSLESSEVVALLGSLRSGAFLRELAASGPYDTSRTGDRIG